MLAGGCELDARRIQRQHTAALLKSARTPLQMVAVVEQAVRVAHDAVGEARAKDPPRAAPACKEGCAWCCYLPVGTAAPEVLRIAAYLRETLPAEELRALQERTRPPSEAKGPAGRPGGRAPCPLLVEDRCAAYPVRPLTCRGYNSSDARKCERKLQPGSGVVVPAYAPQLRVHAFVLDGLRAGLTECRLDGELLDLRAALHIALTVPDAEKRWLAGEPVFVRARLH